ncbi:MAG TPA: 3-phosphoserine/phosphohydroxythreonine transaminase [bacterium]|nr:3-phosphoserine/phosphohydroxythreonine transaminase [bacterium]
MNTSPAQIRPAAKARPAPGRRAYNFNAGPSMMPLSVMEQTREALVDFAGLGAGVVEISHRSAEFLALVEESQSLMRELLAVPANYRILMAHGGGQLQMSMVPFNLIAYRPARRALYIDSGLFASRAADIATRYGYVHVPGHSRDADYDRVPAFDPGWLDPEASYLYITSNNTVMGTRWQTYPDTGALPLVADMTSDILSRRLDISQFGLIFAGAQKNVAPAGLAVVIVREDLLGHALPTTPRILNYAELGRDPLSMANTPSTLSLYMMCLMLRWVKAEGGVDEMERRAERRSRLLYDLIDASGGFYRGYVQPAHRSTMNVTFALPDADRLERFLAEADQAGMYALRGHGSRGGVRASIYNAMDFAGVELLADFMREFQRRNG